MQADGHTITLRHAAGLLVLRISCDWYKADTVHVTLTDRAANKLVAMITDALDRKEQQP